MDTLVLGVARTCSASLFARFQLENDPFFLIEDQSQAADFRELSGGLRFQIRHLCPLRLEFGGELVKQVMFPFAASS